MINSRITEKIPLAGYFTDFLEGDTNGRDLHPVKTYKYIGLIIFCLFLTTSLRAEAAKGKGNIANLLFLDKKSEKKDEPVFIKAKEAVFDNKQLVATYTKGVEVKKGDMTLTARKVKSFFKKNSEGIIRIEAIGDVHLIKGDVEITAGRGIYFEDRKMIEFTDSPRILQGKNILEGEKISFFMLQDKVEISGSVRTVFLPNKSSILKVEKSKN